MYCLTADIFAGKRPLQLEEGWNQLEISDTAANFAKLTPLFGGTLHTPQTE